jgi:hypothetical protein
MILSELFSQPVKWVWITHNSDEAEAEFKVGEVPYKFYGYPDNKKNWEVEFKVDNDFANSKKLSRYSITNTGNAAVVMATIVDILKEFIKVYKNQMDELTFTASEVSRQDLYARMLKKLLPNWSIKVENDKDSGGKRFTALRPKKD